MVYGESDGSAVDVSTASAYSTINEQMATDFVSGSGVSDILPFMGLGSILFPIYAVIDLQTAELLYYQNGNGSGPQGSLASIQQANQ